MTNNYKAELQAMIDVADIHQERIRTALEYIKNKNYINFTAEIVDKFSTEDLAYLELLTNRFAKLQDYLGTKIFPIVLKILEEDQDSYTQLDRLNKLEKINYLPNVEHWKEMRRMRNHFTHEYPDDLEISAANLNQASICAKDLITYWDELKIKLNSLIK